MIWNERRYTWINGQLATIWTFQSDWAEPNAANFNVGAGGLQGWEPVFHPIEANNFIYVPGAAGTVWKVDKTAGTSTSHINPFSGVNGVTSANTFVSGPLSADSSGNIYYNVVQLNVTGGSPWNSNDVKRVAGEDHAERFCDESDLRHACAECAAWQFDVLPGHIRIAA